MKVSPQPSLLSDLESLKTKESLAHCLPTDFLQPNKRVWGVFTSTFLTIFLAEMGDKTQVATLLMSAESQSPWVVFVGAGVALISTSLIGVLLGQWLATKLSPKTLDAAAGASLLFISVMLLWEVVKF